MDLILYGALLLAQAGTSAKQIAMKNCGRLAPGTFNSICINLVRSLICLAVSMMIWLFTDGSSTTFFGHVIIIIAGIGTAFHLFAWILSSQLVSLTLIESVIMTGSMVIPLILAPYLYDGDTVSPLQWLGCALVFVSAFLFMNKGRKSAKEGSDLQKIVILAICTIGITLSSVFKKYYTYYITTQGLGSVEYFTFINFVTAFAVFLMLFAVYYTSERKRAATNRTAGESPKAKLPYKRVWGHIFVAAVALYVNELFTSYATQLPSAIYYPISKGLAVGCTFLLDVTVFREKITLRKLVGFVVVIAAVILINL